MSVKTLLAEDISDPTDFPPPEVTPGLRQLDEALRCSICRELYDVPMTINCGHSYCSLCIRSTLSDKAECPICRQTASEVHLRKNVAMENAVKAWAAARDAILLLLKEKMARKSLGTISEEDEGHDTSASEPSRKRRKTAQSTSDSDDSIELLDGPPTKRRGTSGTKLARRSSSSTSSTTKSPSSDTGPVKCPVCHGRVPLDIINEHIDSKCQLLIKSKLHGSAQSKGKQKQEWSKLLSGQATSRKGKDRAKSEAVEEETAEYLPLRPYQTLKDKQLSEILQEHQLPTAGDRTALIRRHRQWVTMYNANVDRDPADRRSLDQLRRDLRRWEDELNPSKSKKNNVDDLKAYEAANKRQFAKLIEAARQKRPATSSGSNAEQSGHSHSDPLPTKTPEEAEIESTDLPKPSRFFPGAQDVD